MIYLMRKNSTKMMMRLFKSIIYFVIVFPVYAQQSDTSTFQLNFTPGYSYRMESLNHVTNPDLLNTFLQDSTAIWIRTRMQINGLISQRDPIKNNFQESILNSLQEQYYKSQNMKEWKYVLGMVQAGAFGYLAYEHLRKFGFLKKK